MKRILFLAILLLALALPAVAKTVVVVDTSAGAITLELDEVKAPESVRNFLAYADKGHYDGTIFHRVIKNFMIQGGGMTAELAPKPTLPPIKNEAGNGLKNLRGTIAMARTGIVDKIGNAPTGMRNRFSDVPVETVTIKSVKRLKK